MLTITRDAIENDNILVDIEFIDGSINKVRLVDSQDFIDQNMDKILVRKFTPRRARYVQ